MNNLHCRSSRCLSMLHASPPGKPSVRSSLLHLRALAVGRREWGGPGWAAAGWPMCPRGEVCGKRVAASRATSDCEPDIVSPSPKGLHPANDVTSRIAVHARSWSKWRKSKQSWKKYREGVGCPFQLCCVTAEILAANLPANASSSPAPTEAI